MKGKHSASVVRSLREEQEARAEEARRRERDLLDRLARAERRAAHADGLQERCDELERLVHEHTSPTLAHVSDQLARAEHQIAQLTEDGAWRQRLLERAYHLLIPRAGFPSDAAYIEALADLMGPDCNPRWTPGQTVHLDTPTQVAARLGPEAVKRIQRARGQR